MTSFEWFLFTALAFSVGIFSWVGYLAGVQNERARTKGRISEAEAAGYQSGVQSTDAYVRGHRAGFLAGYREHVEEEADEFEVGPSE